MTFQIVKLIDKLDPVIIVGGLVPRGAYDNGTDYAVGDLVTYNNTSYVMYVDAAAGTLPTDTTKWQVIGSVQITVSGTAPPTPYLNQLWYDTS